MPDVTQLLRQGGLPSGQRNFVVGTVSTSKPAPTTFTDQLWVVLPDFSPDHSQPVTWSAIHGQTLPAQGAQVLVTWDDKGQPYALWWAGVTTLVPAGVDKWGVWTALPFNDATQWGNNAGSQPCQYRVGSAGTVQLRGQAKALKVFGAGFVASTLIANCPSFPVLDHVRAVRGNDSGIGETTFAVDVIGGDGRVYVFGESTGRAPARGIGTTIQLDGIEFSTL